MAKKKAVETADAVSDASIPTLEHSHKDPAQRAHVWERPLRSDERAPEAKPHSNFHVELPRWLHKGSDQTFVTTPEEYETATAAGWLVDPNEAL